jgi:methionine-rich copper-binding protein CopC
MKKSIILTFFIMLLLIPAIGYSHVGVVDCSPLQDSVVTTPPEKVTVNFGGSIEPPFSKIEVFDPNGEKVSSKCRFLEEDSVIETDLQENLVQGVYNVKWKIMSLDGHTLKGQFSFTIE